MIDLVLLRSFITVVDTGNFTRAAEHLHPMQSTIGQQILWFGQQLGCRLLNCNQRQVLSTEEDDRLLGYACRLLCLANEASEALSFEYTSGVPRLGMSEDSGSGVLMPLIASSACERPRLCLEAESGLSHHLLRLCRNGDLDMLPAKQWSIDNDCHACRVEPIYWIDSAERPRMLSFGPS